MKKQLLVLVLSTIGFVSGAYEPIQQWMLFRSNYSFINNKVDMSANLNGSESVNAIAEDHNGNIYLAVSGKDGLRMFDGKKLLAPKLPSDSYAANAEILSLAVDSKNTLWVGTAEGLATFDGSQWSNVGSDKTVLTAITQIAITATDKVYLAGFVAGGEQFKNGGLSFYNGSGWVHFDKSNTALPDDTLQDLTLDQNGYLWMTIGNHHGGIARFDGKSWKQFHTGNTEALPTNNVCGIATNKSGTLWFATTKGIVSWDGSAFNLKPYSNGFGNKFTGYANSDGSLDVTGLTVEDDGTLWLATANKGVIYVHDKLVKDYEPGNSLLNSNAVLKTMVDKQHRKWFLSGALNSSWAVFYPEHPKVPYLNNTDGVTVLKENNVVADPNWTVINESNANYKLGTSFSIDEDKEGNIWMPTTGDGLLRIKDDNITVYTPPDMMLTSLMKAYLADDGKIYLATTMKGVKVFDKGTISDFVKWPNMGGVNDMAFDKGHTFWVTGTGGVSRWVNNDWETFNKRNGDLPTVIFYCLLKDSKGMLWVGSAKGLMKYDGTAWQVISKKETPFPSDDITALAEAKDGKLWVGTKSGLSIFDGTGWTHISKVESPKLSKFQVNTISFDQKGNAWIATEQDGLLKYDGSSWQQFDKKTTGVVFDKVTAVKAASDGKVYVISEYYSFNDTDFTMPSQSQEASIQADINKRIKDADPKHIFAIIKNL